HCVRTHVITEHDAPLVFFNPLKLRAEFDGCYVIRLDFTILHRKEIFGRGLDSITSAARAALNDTYEWTNTSLESVVDQRLRCFESEMKKSGIAKAFRAAWVAAPTMLGFLKLI